MNTELLKSKLLEAAFNGSLTHADTSTWEDFALGEIFLMKAGKNVTAADISEEQNEKCPYPCYGGNGLRGYVKDYNTEGIFPIIGRQGALCGNVKYVEGKFFATEHAVIVRNKKEVDSRWAFHALTFLNLNQYATATAQPGLAVSKIEQVRLSLPPLAEQQRIVATLEEGFAYIDAIASAKQNLSISANLLRSKILEDAFKGLLTSADVNKWEIAELGTACKHQNGDRGKNYPSKKKLSHCGIPFISALNLVNNTVIDDDKLLKMSEEQFNKLGNGKLQQGDFVLCIRGSVGKHGIYPFEKGAIASSLVILRPVPDKLSLMWLSYYFDSSLFRENLLEYINGTAQPNLAAKELMKFRIPLPPLAEQQRIVAKIEELFEQIDKITK